ADLVVAVPAVDLVVAGRLVLPDVEGAGVPGVLPHAHVVLRAGPRVGGQRRGHHPRWYEQGRDRRRDAPPDLGTRHGRHLPLVSGKPLPVPWKGMSMFRWMSNPFFFPRQHKSPVRESVNSLALRQERVGKILGKGDEDGVPPAGGPRFLLRSRGFL